MTDVSGGVWRAAARAARTSDRLSPPSASPPIRRNSRRPIGPRQRSGRMGNSSWGYSDSIDGMPCQSSKAIHFDSDQVRKPAYVVRSQDPGIGSQDFSWQRMSELAFLERRPGGYCPAWGGECSLPVPRDSSMPDYMLIYRGGDAGAAKLSPEQMQALMDRWSAWIGQFMASGQMTEPGDALLPGGKVVGPGGAVTDGPFPETKELVGGFSLLRVKDYNEAVAIAKGCPVLESGGAVEIRQMAGYGEKMK